VTEPEFLDVDEVIALHDRQLTAFGGSPGIRDLGLLESAVAQPQATFGGEFVHGDLFAMAAACAFHIAENQPFVDGNKRAALDAALVFLHLNGFSAEDPPDGLYDAMIAIAERRLDKEGLAVLLRKWSKPLP
jgi:death-on-curing protein